MIKSKIILKGKKIYFFINLLTNSTIYVCWLQGETFRLSIELFISTLYDNKNIIKLWEERWNLLKKGMQLNDALVHIWTGEKNVGKQEGEVSKK